MDISLWQKSWQIIKEKYAVSGVSALSEEELTWFILQHIIDETEQNGFLGLMVSDFNFPPHLMVDSWHNIAATDIADLMAGLINILPWDHLPEDEQEKEDLIELWQDIAYTQILHQLEDEFFELLPEAEQNLAELIVKIAHDYQ